MHWRANLETACFLHVFQSLLENLVDLKDCLEFSTEIQMLVLELLVLCISQGWCMSETKQLSICVAKANYKSLLIYSLAYPSTVGSAYSSPHKAMF